MNSVIDLGFISVRIYSICILVGVLFGSNIAIKESVKHGFKEEDITNLIFYAVIFGIIGARLYYCIFNLDYYLNYPLNILKIWEGGLAIHGGIIGGLISSIVYAKRKSINLIVILDYITTGLILAQAIGRWGNFFNGEAHGPITSLGYLKSLFLPDFIIKGMYIDGNYYIPTFLYESLWCLLGFIIMIIFRRMKFMKVGYLTGFYFIWYSIERFVVEDMRTDSLMFFSIKIAQIVSIMMILIGIIIFIYSFCKGLKYNKICDGGVTND